MELKMFAVLLAQVRLTKTRGREKLVGTTRENEAEFEAAGRSSDSSRHSSTVKPLLTTGPQNTRKNTVGHREEEEKKREKVFKLPCSSLRSRRKATPRLWSSLQRPGSSQSRKK